MSKKGKHIICKGRVQGVFFRASTKTEADNLGIRGWVKNMPNGDVEIQAVGTEEQLQLFIKWCHRGPQFASVKEVIVEEREVENFDAFAVMY